MEIPFVKMQGLGNDFVVLDEREHAYGLDRAQLALIADRRYGVGCDQVLILAPPTLEQAAARYGIYNADGSPAEHCGNGVRCVARYLRDRGSVPDDVVMIEIGGAVFDLTFTSNGNVRVNMGPPVFEPAAIPIAAAARAPTYEIPLGDDFLHCGCVSMGNPHAVMQVDDVDDAPVGPVGAALQDHEFFPARVNAGFMQVVDGGRIKLRVFERGVGETLACGTGACAAMAVGREWGLLDERVVAELRGGELQLDWSGDETEPLYMTGPAEYAFEGIIRV